MATRERSGRTRPSRLATVKGTYTYTPPSGPSGDALLLESGDYLLLESGDYILKE